MKIFYLSMCCSDKSNVELEKIVKNAAYSPSQRFHKLVIDGLAIQDGVEVYSISRLPSNKKNCKKRVLRVNDDVENGVHFHNLITINLPILKNIYNFIQTFIYLMKNASKSDIIICDTMQNDLCYGALLFQKLKHSKIVGIVTDIYGHGVSTSIREKIHTSFSGFIVKRLSAFILLTQKMNDIINKDNKPFMIMEGLVDRNLINADRKLKKTLNPRICMYAGGLNEKFGLKEFIDGFISAEIPNCEFHIYGNGSFKEEIEKIAIKNNNIKYCGVVSNSIVQEEERRASLLVNPRIPTEDYCNYSFPSKNMEYLSSGTPMLGTKLPGIPDEYFQYMFLLDSLDQQIVADKLREIFAFSNDELEKMGKKGKEFVLTKKNNYVQANRIISFLQIIGTYYV